MEKRKNCWLIPTDKPSRLCIGHESKLWLTQNELLYIKDDNFKTYPQNIYITSDEEIKEGDWIYKIDHSHTAIFNVHCEELVDDYNRNNNNHKKIIMTTNKDLDGVQRIDDEFLKWFIKNPSCEKVEVLTDSYTMQQIFELKLRPDIFKYKIIIPKEKLSTKLHIGEVVDESYPKAFRKQETLEETFNFQEKLVEYFNNTPREKILEDWDKSVEYDKIGPTMEEFLESKQDYKKLSKKFTETLTSIPDDVLIKYTKQETLEEAAENYGNSIGNKNGTAQFDFIQGAQWQERKMYSKVIEFAEWIRNNPYELSR